MPRVHSHYENLRVARNAPLEVIRAAYRVLSQRHHPDLNAGDPSAVRVMAILNTAYDTLSDPVKRQQHDRWLADAEDEPRPAQVRRVVVEPDSKTGSEAAGPTPGIQRFAWKSRLPFEVFALSGHLRRYWSWYLVALAIFAVATSNETTTRPSPASKAYSSQPPIQQVPVAPAMPAYLRADSAPNGEPWPVRAGYIKGYRRLSANGLSTVTIDNTRNDSDVHVKIVLTSGEVAFPVRHFFIPANSQFTVKSLSPGEYDVRYRDLTSGHLLRTEPFTLSQSLEAEGTRYSNVTMTLYKVQQGNMQTYPLGESDFN